MFKKNNIKNIKKTKYRYNWL